MDLVPGRNNGKGTKPPASDNILIGVRPHQLTSSIEKT